MEFRIKAEYWLSPLVQMVKGNRNDDGHEPEYADVVVQVFMLIAKSGIAEIFYFCHFAPPICAVKPFN
jgi:hypothetical protein